MKLEQGDYLENNYSNFIRQNIPAYEAIWGSFIGHDGSGNFIQINNLPTELQNSRKNFSEYLYTCIESFVCLEEICQSNFSVDFEKPAEYLKVLNQFISFQAHSGRIHDNLSRLLYIYLNDRDAERLIARLYDTYQKRNNVLHGKKLPCRIEDSLVMIVKLDDSKTEGGWTSDLNWNEYNPKEVVILSDYLKDTLNEICLVFNDIINNLIEPINKLIKEYRIVIERENDSENPAVMVSASFEGTVHIEGFNTSASISLEPYKTGKNM
jgi:hypothetical protein